MFTVKDIIIDAYDRTGIFPNATDGLPGEFVTMGLNLLKGLISQYNIRNYLTFTQQKVAFNASLETTFGTDDVTRSITNDVVATNAITIQKIYLKNNINGDNALEMKFMPFQEFDKCSVNIPVYAYRQINDLQFIINFKSPYVGRSVVAYYNEKIVVTLNAEYAISDEYKELYILGLCDKLLTYYPRKDDAMKQYITAELASAISNITAKNAASRLIIANKYNCDSCSNEYFDSGVWLYGN